MKIELKPGEILELHLAGRVGALEVLFEEDVHYCKLLVIEVGGFCGTRPERRRIVCGNMALMPASPAPPTLDELKTELLLVKAHFGAPRARQLMEDISGTAFLHKIDSLKYSAIIKAAKDLRATVGMEPSPPQERRTEDSPLFPFVP